jgi:hypothetical protein
MILVQEGSDYPGERVNSQGRMARPGSGGKEMVRMLVSKLVSAQISLNASFEVKSSVRIRVANRPRRLLRSRRSVRQQSFLRQSELPKFRRRQEIPATGDRKAPLNWPFPLPPAISPPPRYLLSEMREHVFGLSCRLSLIPHGPAMPQKNHRASGRNSKRPFTEKGTIVVRSRGLGRGCGWLLRTL